MLTTATKATTPRPLPPEKPQVAGLALLQPEQEMSKVACLTGLDGEEASK